MYVCQKVNCPEGAREAPLEGVRAAANMIRKERGEIGVFYTGGEQQILHRH